MYKNTVQEAFKDTCFPGEAAEKNRVLHIVMEKLSFLAIFPKVTVFTTNNIFGRGQEMSEQFSIMKVVQKRKD